MTSYRQRVIDAFQQDCYDDLYSVALEMATKLDAPAIKRTLAGKEPFSPQFEQAWSFYPKRDGSNPKLKAWQCWQARLRQGVLAYDLIQGVQRYRAWAEAKGLVGTDKVMQASRFFGKGEEWKNEWGTAYTPPHSTSRENEKGVDLKYVAMAVEARRQRKGGDEWWAALQAKGAGLKHRDLLLLAYDQLRAER